MNDAVLIAGETLVDFLPARSGPLSTVSAFERRPGGAPANVAVALARLERDPRFWTRVGDDPFGHFLTEYLADQDLDGRYVEVDPAAKTTLAFVTHDAAGERTFSFYRDGTADTRLEPGTVGADVLADCEWVHAGGVTLASGSSRAATLDLLERARAAGCMVSFDPNLRPELWADERTFAEVVGDALSHVDVLKATDEELEALGFDGDTPDALANATLESTPHTVLVTRGSEGAVAVADERAPWTGRADHPGFDVDVVDTTGAGDAFVAGAIDALTRGCGLEETLAFACAVAATTTTRSGAMTALPTREAVEKRLEVDSGGR